MTIGRFSLAKVKGHNTSVITVDSWTIVAYCNIPCVKFNEKKITLNAHGWTKTTKARMNMASNEFKLGYKVFVRKGFWFASFHNQTYLFDGEILELKR